MDRLSEIRARCEAATPGPWEVKVKGNTVESHQVMSPGNGSICSAISPKTKNAQFIAHAREDIPYLLSLLEETWEWDMYQCAKREIDRLRGEVERLTADRWIPVGERLPETRCDVLACAFWHETYQTLPAWHAPESGWHVDVGLGYKSDLSVTHWRPLPEPPKEGE